jgi:L-ascorbate metabolism protein UlaG (beta-lactamase superfamily)
LEGYPLVSKDPYTNRFVNPWNSESTNGFKRIDEVWRWKRTRIIGFSEVSTADASTLNSLFELERTTEEMKQNAQEPEIGKIKLTWIGHATNLIQFSDKFTVLTDPMFSNKASPFQLFQQTEFFGVPRWMPPSLRIKDLCKIDVVVISHDHYDHLDLGSVKELNDKKKVNFWAVPLGIKDWLINNIGVKEESIIELEWWQRVKFVKSSNESNALPCVENVQSIFHDRDRSYVEGSAESERNELNVTCAPAQHWCSRSPFDRNTRLWCSWAIQARLVRNGDGMDCSPLNFYFAGDTGYPEKFPLHRQVGDLLGPFDLAAIPIGAYKPRFFMRDSHCDPKEAVKIHRDIRSNRSVAIHWGTFPLANEPFEEPPTVLRKEMNEDNHEFIAIPHGDSICS